MIDLIASIFSEGDYIKVFFNRSSKSVEGRIIKILPSSIAIKTAEGKICGVKGDDIDSFEEGTVAAESPEASTPSAAFTASPESVEKTPDADRASAKEIPLGEHDGHDESPAPGNEAVPDKKEDPNDPLHVYKPGDVIPLEVLHHRDRRLKQKSRLSSPEKEAAGKTGTEGNDLSALHEWAKDRHEADNQKVVPALGVIKFVKPEMNFGFIRDGKTGKDIYFSLTQIVEDGLNSSTWRHAPVVYTLQEEGQGPKALTIHRPKSVQDLLLLAVELAKKDQYKHAFHLVEQILAAYPDNQSASQMKAELERSYPQYNLNCKEYSNAFNKADRYHQGKNYPKAIEYYLIAIKKKEKLESSIKALGMLYVFLYKNKKSENPSEAENFRTKAVELMEKHRDDLPDNISTLNYLENLYYSAKEFDSCIRELEKLVKRQEIARDKDKHSMLLYKKALVLVQLNRSQEAIQAIDEALSVAPDNQAAIKLKALMEKTPDSEGLLAEISAAEFDSLNTGMSEFIQDTLDNYDEYAGVPPKFIGAKEFSEVTLNEIRKVIETAGRARPRERAKYLLTEGKLLTIVEPDNTGRLRSVMARYCNAMSLNHISDYSSGDITRFYYNESFSLEENYRKNATQVALYLLTHRLNFNELMNRATTSPSVDDALKEVLSGEFKPNIWESILSMFLYNREISAQITSKLYSNEAFRAQALEALKYFGLTDLPEPITQEKFREAWNRVRELRIRDYKRVVAQIKAIGSSTALDEIVNQLMGLREMRERESWMVPLDGIRISNITNNIVPAIQTYVRSEGYRNKEASKNNANGQVQQLIEEINDGPTKLSYEALLPLLKRVNQLIVISFNEIIKASAPKITIKLLSSETVVNKENEVSIQIAISNDKDSSPVKEVSVDIENTANVSMLEGSEVSYNAIDGGESQIFKLKIKVDDEIIRQKAASLNVRCRYKTGNEQAECSSPQTLRLYSPEDYCPIGNPYAPFAGGGPVEDSNMFYGREEFIANITDAIINSPSKQVIIYGQKRSGKSSVLSHLKKRLMDTGKTFCISFSLGDISGNLTEASFYHKILNTIQQELELGQALGVFEQIPSFGLPPADNFKAEDKENPLNTFTKYMVKFKLACRQTPGWEDKKLVVMIDEFTYLYTEIKEGHISPSIMKQWKAVTQNERAQFSVVLVGQDVVPSFKKEDYARNAFGVIQDIRLTYLQEAPARALIEEPILDEHGRSRYIDNAVTKILEYTSRNPYYIQIFCSRLVDYMNRNKSISVTEADVIDVANSFVSGSEALIEDNFDGLIRAGEKKDQQEFGDDEILQVLRQIASNSRIIGFCNRNDISALPDKAREDAILKQLVDREVLELRGENNYKIQVRLFQEWLLNH